MSTAQNGEAAGGAENGCGGASERSPLLPRPAVVSEASEESTENVENGHANGVRTYNRGQVVLLSCCRMVDPIAFFCIVPFVNQMIYDTGTVRQEDVGFYSGLIVGHHSFPTTAYDLPYA
jgi:hypothetical protein